jgi:hypothetical protein
MHHFWQIAPARERRSRFPLKPVFGGGWAGVDSVWEQGKLEAV